MNRIFQKKNGQWTFWDETDNEFGISYPTKKLAEEALMAYSHWLDTGEITPPLSQPTDG